MTYDDWKLDNGEDERARRHGRFAGLRCRDCGTLNFPDEETCRNCDSPDLENNEPDPDDARDARMDR